MSGATDGTARSGPAGDPVGVDTTRNDAERSFEDLVSELETITERLAGGELGIEAAADLYERAQQLHGLATERLEAVQKRIEKLAGASDPGR
jgi:exodeoxyribonuclease VII small subunit